jgi:hypothetical protein
MTSMGIRSALAALALLIVLAASSVARADVTITGGGAQPRSSNSAHTTVSDNINQVDQSVVPVTGPFVVRKTVQAPAADVSSSFGTVHAESSATLNATLTSDAQTVHLTFDGSASGAANDTNTHDPNAQIFGSGQGETGVTVEFTVTTPIHFTLSGSFTERANAASGSGASLFSLAPGAPGKAGIADGTSNTVSGSLDPGRYELFVFLRTLAQVRGTGATESEAASAHGTVDFTLGGGSSCPNGQVSSVTAGLAVAEGCFTERKDPQGNGTGVFETDQQAWIGGFEVDPQPGGKFVVDARTPALRTAGSGVDVKVGGFFAPIRVQDLPITSSSGTFDLNQAGTIEKAILALPIKGKSKASWSDGGKSSSLEGDVTISKFVGSFAFVTTNSRGSEGEIKFKLKQANRTGLVINQASVKIDEVTLIPSEFKVPNTLALHNLTLTYELRNGKPFWSGGGVLSIPLKNGPFDIGGRVFFFDGSLAGGGIGVDGINKEIPDTPPFLQKLAGDLLFRPDWAIRAGIGATFGPRLEGKQIATLDGNVATGTLVGPSECPTGNDPFKIEAQLKLNPLDNLTSQLAKVEMTTRTCAYVGAIVGQDATIKGTIEFGNIEAGTILGYEGMQSGFIGQSGFDLEGGVTISIPLLPKINGHAIISNQGLAACGSLNFAQAGFGYRWDSRDGPRPSPAAI